MPDGSVRTLMQRWRKMGKAVGRKETVPLNHDVLLGRADSVDYPGLLSDVLEKVTEMTGGNWQEKAGELEEMLEGLVRQ